MTLNITTTREKAVVYFQGRSKTGVHPDPTVTFELTLRMAGGISEESAKKSIKKLKRFFGNE